MKPTTTAVFPCSLPPHTDEDGNIHGGILFPISLRDNLSGGMMDDPHVTFMMLLMRLNVAAKAAKVPPMVEGEA